MRSSSVKTIVVTVTLAAAVSLAVAPAVQARPTQARDSAAAIVAADPIERAFMAVQRLYKRVVSLAVPVIPLPAPSTSDTRLKK
ncbi:MAG TPA: hypothetical protein VE010_12725 [Thermoanaerobaculia bacterium]|nr:hypothetical protein [Thermoanaerobaculia bacterium]